MPFLGVAPWRRQYFSQQPCPDDVVVPVDDPPTWDLYPEHRWIYNKLAICETQDLPHGPHGTEPPEFPVFSKPIYNLRGMGADGRVIGSAEEYDASLTPGHFWMPLLTGAHVSTDLALLDGRIAWCRHTTGMRGVRGHLRLLDRACRGDARAGIVSRRLERATSARLHRRRQYRDDRRPDHRMPSAHGRSVGRPERRRLARGRRRALQDRRAGVWRSSRRTGYSVVLFGAPGVAPAHRPCGRRGAAEHAPSVSSIQITFDESQPAAAHAMPPGGFRLAIVNCWDLGAGNQVRSQLRRLFSTTARRERPSLPTN